MSKPTITLNGSTLTIVCDVSEKALKAAPPSKSGKTRVVCSTNGFVQVSDNLALSLNLTSK